MQNLEQDWSLRLNQISKQYPGARKAALSNVTLNFRSGVIKAIVGPNGAGKSTLFRIISGLMEADVGTIDSMNETVRGTRPSVSLLPDSNLGYYPNLSVLQNFIYLSGVNSVRVDVNNRKEPRDWLARFNLEDRLCEQCQKLSRGMLQRLGLAIATAASSDVLLLDEPTNGLDIEESLRLFDLIKRIAAASSCIVAFSSHQPDAILELADEVALLVDGNVQAEISREELKQYDSSLFVERYISVVARARGSSQPYKERT